MEERAEAKLDRVVATVEAGRSQQEAQAAAAPRVDVWEADWLAG